VAVGEFRRYIERSRGSDPRLLRLTMDGYFDGTLGATPCIKIVRTMGLDLSSLDGAVLIPKPIVSAR
jgi:hypothetical protein